MLLSSSLFLYPFILYFYHLYSFIICLHLVNFSFLPIPPFSFLLVVSFPLSTLFSVPLSLSRSSFARPRGREQCREDASTLQMAIVLQSGRGCKRRDTTGEEINSPFLLILVALFLSLFPLQDVTFPSPDPSFSPFNDCHSSLPFPSPCPFFALVHLFPPPASPSPFLSHSFLLKVVLFLLTLNGLLHVPCLFFYSPSPK